MFADHWRRDAAKAADGHLRGVEKWTAFFVRDCSDEDAVCCTGDEVSDAGRAGEKRHGVAIGGGSQGGRLRTLKRFVAVRIHVGLEGALPGGAATLEGGLGRSAAWSGSWRDVRRGCGICEGLGESGQRWEGHGCFLHLQCAPVGGKDRQKQGTGIREQLLAASC